MAPALLILHFGVVHREEEYLEQKFGDSYREYKASVPRYRLKLSARSQRQVSGTH
jgi:protein-S-isoprenylcysteine O-methyltransferase Ste14